MEKVFKVDFIDGEAVSWRKTGSGVEAKRHPGYRPRFYVEGDTSKLQKSRSWLTRQEGIEATVFERWKPTLSKPKKKVLRVDTSADGKLRKAAHRLKREFGRSTFRFYNVGFSPQFRFCLQKEICPVPERDLDRVDLSLHRKQVASGEVSGLRFNGEEVTGDEDRVLDRFQRLWKQKDPDLVVVNRGEVLRLLSDKFQDGKFSLGRLNRFQTLAGENTVSSYGKTVHSAARYNVPGRIVVDRSNSFLLGEATLEGLWDLVRRSYRPMQELAWGSIGRLLTSIEVRRAYLEENTLTPWKNWSGEAPKEASKVHRADRGGFIFNPEPGVHRDVYEADFASLFPNIMVERNISPETVCCECCSNGKTPELGYSICQESEGFIPRVLKPLIDDRQEMKERLDTVQDEEERRYMQGSIDAIKWLLVSCFGYMGHSHASYGAIRCHQAIQAFDREIMVETKEMFEESGYSVAHGIIDSIWVQKQGGAEPFQKVCSRISDRIGIKLEPEHRFEWCAFVPRSSSEADISTLNRYFGKKENGEFKTAGIETEQRSTCSFVKDAQMKMIKALDRDMKPEDVFEVLQEKIRRLEETDVDTDRLVKKKRASKSLESYSVENRTVSALKRAQKHGIETKPGQSIEFVVRDDSASSMGRTRLKFEAEQGEYDPNFYRKEVIRAAESVLSPLGLDRDDIEKKVEGVDTGLRTHL